ncbi:ribosomal RNA small subunit methyltransferase NEP1-like [Coccinella septempunctata]|uniref:ribosomal RNA small subunit methyltransferase NEP1-like n=1 Tax=Coccinella septempunctata TaxID=41139 RepID=UPI001D080BDF|nr:ribosomal RNA small subunit methyltransferase NEP1-like [Coccinella septempunctata]
MGKRKRPGPNKKSTFDEKAAKKKKDRSEEFEFDPMPKHLVIAHLKNQEKRLIIILENAQLETVKIGEKFQLLNSDNHSNILRKNGRDLGSCRPDIAHQCLLMLFNSPLNRAALLQVYVHTSNNVLIEIDPQTKIPDSFQQFAKMIVQLLHKFTVRAKEGKKLLKVIKNPITDHLPIGVKKICMSFSSEAAKHPSQLVPNNGEPIAFVIGAMARGKLNVDYTEETYSISNYPLSAALTCSKLCFAFENAWGVHS